MFEKSFITDCEGPLTLNDNAFELAAKVIEDGDELFKILSLYDDYLADVVKKENYKAGNTLKLILPFFVCENLKNMDMVDFSRNNIYSVNDSKFLLNYLKKAMNIYIVSTSYGQYIEAVSNYMDVPFEKAITLYPVHEAAKDYLAEVEVHGNMLKHRYGCSGIDGITLGPGFGSESKEKTCLYVAYGVYSDTLRCDNDYNILLCYDLEDLSTPIHKYFIYTGNTKYGVQNLAYRISLSEFLALPEFLVCPLVNFY